MEGVNFEELQKGKRYLQESIAILVQEFEDEYPVTVTDIKILEPTKVESTVNPKRIWVLIDF